MVSGFGTIPVHALSGRMREQLSRTSGSARIGTLNKAAKFFVPPQPADIEEQRAAGVGVVGGEHFAAGEAIDQIGIDRADQCFAGFELLPNIGPLVDQPFQLRAGKVSVELKARFVLNGLFVAGVAQFAGKSASPRRHCQTIALCSGRPVCLSNTTNRFALVGDRQSGDRVQRDRGCGSATSPTHRQHVLPDFFGVVLHPARLRINLAMLATRLVQRLAPPASNSTALVPTCSDRWRECRSCMPMTASARCNCFSKSAVASLPW